MTLLLEPLCSSSATCYFDDSCCSEPNSPKSGFSSDVSFTKRLTRSKSLPPALRRSRSKESVKRVRFADSLGLDLEKFQYFVKEDLSSSPQQFSIYFSSITSSSSPPQLPAFTKTLINQPAPRLVLHNFPYRSEHEYNLKTRESKVCVSALRTSGSSIVGQVNLLNVAFDKVVVVRYTTNGWERQDQIVFNSDVHKFLLEPLCSSSSTCNFSDSCCSEPNSPDSGFSSDNRVVSDSFTERLTRSKSLPPALRRSRSEESVKRVRFADSLGLDLEKFQYFVKEDLSSSPQQFSIHFSSIPSSSSPPQLPAFTKTLINQPAPRLVLHNFPYRSEHEYNLKTRESKVCVSALRASGSSIVGQVNLLNVAFDKVVVVRYTTNGWERQDQIVANYSHRLFATEDIDAFNFTSAIPIKLTQFLQHHGGTTTSSSHSVRNHSNSNEAISYSNNAGITGGTGSVLNGSGDGEDPRENRFKQSLPKDYISSLLEQLLEFLQSLPLQESISIMADIWSLSLNFEVELLPTAEQASLWKAYIDFLECCSPRNKSYKCPCCSAKEAFKDMNIVSLKKHFSGQHKYRCYCCLKFECPVLEANLKKKKPTKKKNRK